MGQAGGHPTPYVSIGTYGDFEKVLGCQQIHIGGIKTEEKSAAPRLWLKKCLRGNQGKFG